MNIRVRVTAPTCRFRPGGYRMRGEQMSVTQEAAIGHAVRGEVRLLDPLTLGTETVRRLIEEVTRQLQAAPRAFFHKMTI